MDEEPGHWWDKARREHEESLAVGQRVRVDIGECRHFLYWHGTIEQGETGDIISTDTARNGAPEDHRYWVQFDWPIRGRRFWYYSAHELTPLPKRTPEEIEREVLARLDR